MTQHSGQTGTAGASAAATIVAGRLEGPTGLALDDRAADLLFREAHTAYRFTEEPVTDAQVRAIHDLVKWAPTAMNAQPLRVTLVRTPQARERVIARLAPGNRAKAASAPLIAILSYDVDFHDTLPEVLPSNPSARDGFAEEAGRHAFGQFNAALQAGYWMLGIRAAGLAAGPMGGFDRAGVDADFFPDGRQRSFLVVNIGHPAPDGTFPRNPRLPFERVVSAA
ncbi:MAG: malonic semialdehyde reductase [Candidatus Nanopelagicales bacterium]|jgi:3-hydroxypropanoate dehydrogenase|nr:malonic semialdehyde reductase [Candidatus Nanopelagicales bacterium]